MKKISQSSTSIICAIISIAVLVGIWEILAYSDWQYANIFPSPSHFLRDLSQNGFRIGLGSSAAGIPESIASSFFRVFAGLGIGFACALATGMVISMSVWVKRFSMPVIELLAPIAPIAWIPLALVVFGIGNQTAIFIVFMGVFFMLTIATVKAIETVPEHLISVAKTLGAKRLQLWAHVIFPFILPQVFTILRINFIAAWMAVLAAEMTGLRDGLGAIIMNGRNLFDNNLILLGMCLIGVSGFVIDVLLKWIQKKFFWWDTQRN
jgi:NitT/TauT family transport system permease protein